MIWNSSKSSKASSLDTSNSPERDLAACLWPRSLLTPISYFPSSFFGWITKKLTLREAVSVTIFHISEGHSPSFVRERNGLVLNGKWNEFLKYQEAETISKALPLALLAAKRIPKAKKCWLYLFKCYLICQNTSEYSRTIISCCLPARLRFLPPPPSQDLNVCMAQY